MIAVSVNLTVFNLFIQWHYLENTSTLVKFEYV